MSERRVGLALALGFGVAAAAVVAAYAGTGQHRSGPRVAAARVEAAPAAERERGRRVFVAHCQACHGRGGRGGVGPRLTGGDAVARFPEVAAQVAFVEAGSRPGKAYGVGGQGTGGMPGWGRLLSNDEVRAVVAYERSL